MFSDEVRSGMINSLGIVAGLKSVPASIQLMDAVIEKVIEVGFAEVTAADIGSVKVVVDGKEKGLTEPQANKVFAAIEVHKAISQSTARKAREKKPSISERYVVSTTEEDRDSVAVKVANIRINATGSKPMSWKKIRERLGLKLDEFHKIIRHSEGYREAVINRIKTLKAQQGGWTYNGKMDVLTGIDLTEEELAEEQGPKLALQQ